MYYLTGLNVRDHTLLRVQFFTFLLNLFSRTFGGIYFQELPIFEIAFARIFDTKDDYNYALTYALLATFYEFRTQLMIFSELRNLGTKSRKLFSQIRGLRT